MKLDKEKMSKVWSTVSLILVIAATVAVICTALFSTVVDRNKGDLFGIRFYIVQGNSMSLSENNKDLDVHFNAYDVVVIKSVKDKTALDSGDVIAFLSMNPDQSYGKVVTHMIRDRKEDAQGRLLGYVTFGTNTGEDDRAVVDPSFVIGEYAGKIPWVGHVFTFIRTLPGFLLCIFLPLTLLILYNVLSVVRLSYQYKQEQTEALEAERAELAAERQQNQDMMRELRELKAKLSEQEGEAPSEDGENRE